MAIYKQASFDNGEKFPRYAIITEKNDKDKYFKMHVVVTSEDKKAWYCTSVNKPSAENIILYKRLYDCELGPLAELYYKKEINYD